MGQDDLEACAVTLLLVGAEAGRAGLDDVATPANAGAAEIYRLLERDDLAQVLLRHRSRPREPREARCASTMRLEAGLEAARSVVNPTRPASASSTRGLSSRGTPGGGMTSPLCRRAASRLGGADITMLLLVGS